MDRAARRRLDRAIAKNDAPRIAGIWFSNAPWAPTGYGTQTRQVVSRMVSDGHKIVVAANYGLEATQSNWEGIEVWPKGFDAYSNDVVGPYLVDWARQHPELPNVIFTLYDVWPLKGTAWDEHRVVSWVPIDHLPAPPEVVNFLAKPNVLPIAMSKFGLDQINRAGLDARYIPHAIDTQQIYKPTAVIDLGQGPKTGRQIMGVPEDAFVVMMNAANKGVLPTRKAFAEQLLAFALFSQRHSDAVLYLHTERFGAMGGIPLDPLLKAVGLDASRVFFVNQYAYRVGIPDQVVAALYSSADVLLSASLGEGFGLGVIEAQACELRCIVNGFSSQQELVTDESFIVEGQPWWDPAQASWFHTPSVPALVSALENAYQKGHERASEARKWVEHTYDADTVFQASWRPLLAELGQPVETPTTSWSTPKTGKPRLSIYIPTFRRPELANLLQSLAPQLRSDVEVIISDNDGSAAGIVQEQLADVSCRVDYSTRRNNIGGDANIMRAYEVAEADWVWILGDDDQLLPGAVDQILQHLDDPVDRLILLSDRSPRTAEGFAGPASQLAKVDPALLIAATLISANVVRKSAIDTKLGWSQLETSYPHAWSWTTCQSIAVLPPCIVVGRDHCDEMDGAKVPPRNQWQETYLELLAAMDANVPLPNALAWNFINC